MKKIRTILASAALTLGLAFGAQAQILYKVEKDGSDKVSYLLGTHHFAPLSVVDSIEQLPAILAGVDRLYGEIDMSQMTDPIAMAAMQQILVAPADSTLDKILTAPQLDSLRTVWNEYSGGMMPVEGFYPFKPSVIAAQLAVMMSQKVLPQLNPLEGIDMTMQNRARELGKPVGGLESMEFQMDMLYNRPISEQAEGLMKTISDAEGEEKRAIELSKAYLAHDIDRILDMMLVMENDDAQAAEKMIYSRNDRWVAQLAEEMPEQSIMVVVGAGHLPGERGVIAGLRKAGFKVTAVR